MFWVIAGLMVAATLALILRTLTERRPAETADGQEEIDVCRAQLAELARDVEAGLVSAEDASASRLEIERRLLRADELQRLAQAAPSPSLPAVSARRRMAAIVAVAITPLAAVGLYLTLGHPAATTAPQRQAQTAGPEAAPQAAAPGESAPALEVLVGRLEERLESSPEDARGWGLLGRSYTVLGQYAKAADAYRKAVALTPDSAELQSGLGEALALSVEGQVTPEALAAFRRALRLDPADAAARFYIGMADYQQGRFRAALDAWAALVKDAPSDAPWLPDVLRQIAAVAGQLGVDPKDYLPERPAAAAAQMAPPAVTGDSSGPQRGPSAEDMQAASEMSDADRQAMVAGMVSGLAARLEENPDNPEGWRMLARSYGVLGELEKAVEAYRRLTELRPDDVSARNDYAQALFALGKAEARRGDRAAAEGRWRRIVELLPASDPLHKETRSLLERR